MNKTEPPGPEPVAGRPRGPASYGIAKGPGPQMLPWAEAQERLRQARNYWLATTRPNGRPHVMPVWGLWLEDGLYFATDAASRVYRLRPAKAFAWREQSFPSSATRWRFPADG